MMNPNSCLQKERIIQKLDKSLHMDKFDHYQWLSLVITNA